jgi:hypothetical protein
MVGGGEREGRGGRVCVRKKKRAQKKRIENVGHCFRHGVIIKQQARGSRPLRRMPRLFKRSTLVITRKCTQYEHRTEIDYEENGSREGVS